MSASITLHSQEAKDLKKREEGIDLESLPQQLSPIVSDSDASKISLVPLSLPSQSSASADLDPQAAQKLSLIHLPTNSNPDVSDGRDWPDDEDSVTQLDCSQVCVIQQACHGGSS